jgi:hypothetical protein
MPGNKFSAKRTVVDGITFDSKAEAKRWFDLRTLALNGVISDLERQVRYDFAINGVKLGFYKADFRYRNERGELVVEDVKGVRTPMFSLKAKLMKALHGVTIAEIGRKGRAM